MTIRGVYQARLAGHGTCHEGERVLFPVQPELPDFDGFAPRGWQANPVISREAAAMCALDYKSALWRPCHHNKEVGTKLHTTLTRLRGHGR